MKAQDYVDKYLPKVNEVKTEQELKDLCYNAFLDFSDEVKTIIKERHAVKDTAVISIIKEVGQKWNKFCRLMNEKQQMGKLNEDLFLTYWKKELNF